MYELHPGDLIIKKSRREDHGYYSFMIIKYLNLPGTISAIPKGDSSTSHLGPAHSPMNQPLITKLQRSMVTLKQFLPAGRRQALIREYGSRCNCTLDE